MKLLRYLLFPVSLIYKITTTIRNWFFNIGIFKSTTFKTPIIVVGNLSVGGTGKTPQIEYLVRILKEDFKIGILSRGYKRKTDGYLKVDDSHTALDVGDEPLQFYKKFKNKITVAVDANRVNGIQNLIKDRDIEVILLDDAFQHRKVEAKFYILLTKYDDLFIDDYLLPTGNLRESRNGFKRANCIIVTKCPENLSVVEQNKIRARLNIENSQELFFTSIRYNTILKGKDTINIDSLLDIKIVLITGIASPQPLLNHLDNKGIQYDHLRYKDHHSFSEKDIKHIMLKSKNKIILTTEKDYVRLQNRLNLLYYIDIETYFISDKNQFDTNIKEIISY